MPSLILFTAWVCAMADPASKIIDTIGNKFLIETSSPSFFTVLRSPSTPETQSEFQARLGGTVGCLLRSRDRATGFPEHYGGVA